MALAYCREPEANWAAIPTQARKSPMPETPTFGRYAEIPYDEMTPEQQAGYNFLLETRGPLGGPRKMWVHNTKLGEAIGPRCGQLHPGLLSLTERELEIPVI